MTINTPNYIFKTVPLKNINLEVPPVEFNCDLSCNISLVLAKSNKLNPKKMVLTNLHHDLDYKTLLKKVPKNVIPAYDGLKINL